MSPPTLRTGKLCYLEIPAFDIHRSAFTLVTWDGSLRAPSTPPQHRRVVASAALPLDPAVGDVRCRSVSRAFCDTARRSRSRADRRIGGAARSDTGRCDC